MEHKLFQIFRAGTFTALQGQQITFSEGDLQNMAAVFDPQRRPAPLVLGHPEDDQPEMGQAKKLLVKDGNLYAIGLVGAALVELVRTRRYAKISPAFFEPFADNNPTPGAYYLKHIGFLGAHPPSVKGMEPPNFADRDAGICFSEADAIAMPKASQTFSISGLAYDQERLVLHRRAIEFSEACPALSYTEAVTLAQGVLTF